MEGYFMEFKRTETAFILLANQSQQSDYFHIKVGKTQEGKSRRGGETVEGMGVLQY